MHTSNNSPTRVAPPTDEAELLARVRAVAGLTLEEAARRDHLAAPRPGRAEKGWAGNLLESLLGATAGSRPEPDFPGLGVELKTIPVSRMGRPLESTFVCNVPMRPAEGLTWEQSVVWRKLRRVLFVPLLRLPGSRRDNQRIGLPVMWSPTESEARALRQDWEELMEYVALGRFDLLSADIGEVLQVRPKAANSTTVTAATDSNGLQRSTLPRGFYLRSGFTCDILSRESAR